MSSCALTSALSLWHVLSLMANLIQKAESARLGDQQVSAGFVPCGSHLRVACGSGLGELGF